MYTINNSLYFMGNATRSLLTIRRNCTMKENKKSREYAKITTCFKRKSETWLRTAMYKVLEEAASGTLKHIMHLKNIDETTRSCLRTVGLALEAVAKNTENVSLNGKEITCIQRICEELEAIYNEIIDSDDKSLKKDLGDKVFFIIQVFYCNSSKINLRSYSYESVRKYLIMKSYRSLLEITHRINTEWEDLCSRGLVIEVITDYFDSIPYDSDMSEEEKLDTFMKMLDGEMKFVPTYQLTYNFTGYKLLPYSSTTKEVVNDELVKEVHKQYKIRRPGEQMTESKATENSDE